jgi:hypothetical protein
MQTKVMLQIVSIVMTESKLIKAIDVTALGNFRAFECGIRTTSCKVGPLKQRSFGMDCSFIISLSKKEDNIKAINRSGKEI